MSPALHFVFVFGILVGSTLTGSTFRLPFVPDRFNCAPEFGLWSSIHAEPCALTWTYFIFKSHSASVFYFASCWPSLAFRWVGSDLCLRWRWYVEVVALHFVSFGYRLVFLSASCSRRGCLHLSLAVGVPVCELAGIVALPSLLLHRD